MKILASLILFCLAAEAGAGEWAVRLKAVNGKAVYSHTLESPLGEQASYAGKPQMRGGGPAREIIFNTYLNKPEDGLFRLDYQVELTGVHKARPPFQAQGKAALWPGKPVLAAEAGGWKILLELLGDAEGKTRRAPGGVIDARLKCRGSSYPVSFVYLPDQQYSVVLYDQDGDTVRRFMAGLLPNGPGADGTFKLQYTLQLKEGSEALAEGQGELILAPGGGAARAAAGACTFSAGARR